MRGIRLTLFVAGLLLMLPSTAQQDPVYSQYMYNQFAINPAYAGINDVICLNATARNQWVGIDGAPNTLVFDAHAPVKPFGINSGVGISIMNDKFGFENDIALNLAYSYKIDLRNGKLGIGANAGFFNKAMKNTEWITPEGTATEDDAIPASDEKAFGFDMGLGIYYRTDNLYLGVSAAHLLQPGIKFQKATSELKRHYYVLAGYRIQLPNPLFEVHPSTMIMTDGKLAQITLNTNLVYNKKFWGGVSYRAGSAIVGMVGIELFNGLRVGYSYDFVTTDIRNYGSATHEITLGYCFNMKVEKTPQKYKSVRFL
jgi:type IX secretion system PorP/SprF family membrane protein